jgi:hypothetical protein
MVGELLVWDPVVVEVAHARPAIAAKKQNVLRRPNLAIQFLA